MRSVPVPSLGCSPKLSVFLFFFTQWWLRLLCSYSCELVPLRLQIHHLANAQATLYILKPWVPFNQFPTVGRISLARARIRHFIAHVLLCWPRLGRRGLSFIFSLATVFSPPPLLADASANEQYLNSNTLLALLDSQANTLGNSVLFVSLSLSLRPTAWGEMTTFGEVSSLRETQNCLFPFGNILNGSALLAWNSKSWTEKQQKLSSWSPGLLFPLYSASWSIRLEGRNLQYIIQEPVSGLSVTPLIVPSWD